VYTKDGTGYFIVDGHTHFWDGSPANQANRYGEGFIKCFYDYHVSLSPDEYKWPMDHFERYSEEDMVHDLFEIGYDDIAILQSTYLNDWYVNIVNGRWDPRDGENGLAELERLHERWQLKGVKLYTAEWKGDSKGWKLSDPWAYRYLEKCQELGIRNIHVHKGPTVYPMNRDAFDVADVDDAATAFPDLRFIVEHVGLPRLEDFCWIASQEPNVYGGLAVAMPFINARPRYFAQIISELLYWVAEDRLVFASDYALWSPRWLIDKFMAFELPEDLKEETGQDLTLEVKRKILGLNAARLYGVEVPAVAAAATVGGQ
jgi:uncharacterized protein